MSLTELARLFLFVREDQSQGQNHGRRVNAIQVWSGGSDGQSWCAYFATMMLDILYKGAAPIPRLGLVQDIYQLAKVHGWVTSTPSVDDLVISVDENDHGHHIAILTGLNPLTAIAGNTSADGTSSNGDRVAEHAISAAGKVFVHYPR